MLFSIHYRVIGSLLAIAILILACSPKFIDRVPNGTSKGYVEFVTPAAYGQPTRGMPALNIYIGSTSIYKVTADSLEKLRLAGVSEIILQDFKQDELTLYSYSRLYRMVLNALKKGPNLGPGSAIIAIDQTHKITNTLSPLKTDVHSYRDTANGELEFTFHKPYSWEKICGIDARPRVVFSETPGIHFYILRDETNDKVIDSSIEVPVMEGKVTPVKIKLNQRVSSDGIVLGTDVYTEVGEPYEKAAPEDIKSY